MADPLSVTASLLAVVAAAVQSTITPDETVKRFKDRDKLLQGPVERCHLLCRDFGQAMVAFSGKTKTGIRDWAKMEFMRGDINEFIHRIAGYKATISVGLGAITLGVAISKHI